MGGSTRAHARGGIGANEGAGGEGDAALEGGVECVFVAVWGGRGGCVCCSVRGKGGVCLLQCGCLR